MFESFVTAFIVYFVVIDPIGTAPAFLAVTAAQDRARKLRTAIEGSIAATGILFFFAICGALVLAYLKITPAAFKIAGGVILFLIAYDMLTARRQKRKREDSAPEIPAEKPKAKSRTVAKREPDTESLAIYPLAMPLLAGPGAITSVIVVNTSFADALTSTVIGYSALLAAMVVTGIVLCVFVFIESWLNDKIMMVLSRIAAIILAGLSVQYIVDGLTALGVVSVG